MKNRVCVVNCSDFDSCFDYIKSLYEDFDLFFIKADNNFEISYQKEMSCKTNFIEKILSISSFTDATIYFIGKFNLFGKIMHSILVTKCGKLIDIVDSGSEKSDNPYYHTFNFGKKKILFISNSALRKKNFDNNILLNKDNITIYSNRKISKSLIKRMLNICREFEINVIALSSNACAYCSKQNFVPVVLKDKITIFYI